MSKEFLETSFAILEFVIYRVFEYTF